MILLTDGKGGEGKPKEKKEIIIELAPIDAVPHAVHLFLEQVEHGLWNQSDASFYLHGDHVVQAGPKIDRAEEEHHEEENYVRTSLKMFQDVGLDTLAFPDYSEEYPHVEWTIGFAGRPGGPDFYINWDDNTELHGPGGQYQHALEEQGDSCFGRIKSGQDVLTALDDRATIEDGTDWDGFFLEPVTIVGAVILTPKPAPAFTYDLSPSKPQDILHVDNEETKTTEIVDDPFGAERRNADQATDPPQATSPPQPGP